MLFWYSFYMQASYKVFLVVFGDGKFDKPFYVVMSVTAIIQFIYKV